MKINFNENSPRGLALNAGLAALSGFLLIFIFFEVYLPFTTNFGETITVPDLHEMPVDKVEAFLEERDLRFIIADSGYDEKVPPLTVMKQEPAAGSRVKIDRRIHLTIRSLNPPKENLPDIYDNQVRQADRLLESYGFVKGQITYVPDIAKNAVKRVLINGREILREEIKKGFAMEKGTVIDLEVGDGLGESELPIPDFRGKPLIEVEVYLRGIGLTLGEISYVNDKEADVGTVLRQSPAYGANRVVKVGTTVDLWVAGYEPEVSEDENR